MKPSERNSVYSIVLSTIITYIVWFVLPFYNISMISIKEWTYLLIVFTWFVGIGFGVNMLNAMTSLKKAADKHGQ